MYKSELIRNFDDYIAKKDLKVRCDPSFQAVAEKLRKELLELDIPEAPPAVTENAEDNSKRSRRKPVHFLTRKIKQKIVKFFRGR